MNSSFLHTLRAGPPPPKVAFLPDALFFSRTVPLAAAATAAEAAAQVAIALEAISPFPLTQLYYGWFWLPGADHALVFASYRRRFTSEQTATWRDDELVLPSFAALLGGNVQPATTLVLASPEGLTAVHWERGPVPARVMFHALLPEASDDDRALAREDLIRTGGGSRTVVDLAAPPVADPAVSDRETVFRSGDFVSRLPAAVTAALDVRDKGDLAQLRAARRRDVILWRVALGCAAALVLFAASEFALIGGAAWQKVRVAKLTGQQPRVEKIMESQALANRIDELTTKRLLPMEMLGMLVGEHLERKPGDIVFTKVQTLPARGLYTLIVEAQTNNPPQIPVYESALKSSPMIENAEARMGPTNGNTATFTLTVTFKPETIKPEPAPSA